MKTAVIYARVSSTGERQSTARQVADLTNYANLNGLSVVGVYEEHISGAKRNEERAVLTECINDALTNGVEVVLFSELSRCGRAVWEVLDTIRTLKDNGINAYFQKEGLSLFSADGKENPYLAVMVSVLGLSSLFLPLLGSYYNGRLYKNCNQPERKKRVHLSYPVH